MMFFGGTPRRLRLLAPGSVPSVGAAGVALQAEVNRGMNFYVVASLAVLAVSMLPGLWTRVGWLNAADDVILAAIAGSACAWYFDRRNRVRRSPVPLSLLGFGVLTKVGGTVLAYWSGIAAAADAAAALFLALTAAVTTWQLAATHRSSRAVVRIANDDSLFEALRERDRFRQPPTS